MYYLNNLCKISFHVRFEQLQLGVPCYQHRPGLLNIWFLMKVTRNPTAEPIGKPNSSKINVINCGNSDTGYFHTITEGFRSSLMEGEIIYYHGTNAESANSILETGINLGKSTPRQDFSNGVGFYVTPDLEKAVRKAKIKASMYNIPWRQGAIIGFRICEKLRKEKRHLTLTLETEADKMVWTNVVLHYRNGEKSPDMSQALKHMKFIEGPAARYREKIPTPYWNYNQFCIREKDYARRFGSLENICFVIFFL